MQQLWVALFHKCKLVFIRTTSNHLSSLLFVICLQIAVRVDKLMMRSLQLKADKVFLFDLLSNIVQQFCWHFAKFFKNIKEKKILFFHKLWNRLTCLASQCFGTLKILNASKNHFNTPHLDTSNTINTSTIGSMLKGSFLGILSG